MSISQLQNDRLSSTRRTAQSTFAVSIGPTRETPGRLPSSSPAPSSTGSTGSCFPHLRGHSALSL